MLPLLLCLDFLALGREYAREDLYNHQPGLLQARLSSDSRIPKSGLKRVQEGFYILINHLNNSGRWLSLFLSKIASMYEGYPEEKNLFIKNCVFILTFKLQSSSKYSPFDAIHLLRWFFHCSKQFLNC